MINKKKLINLISVLVSLIPLSLVISIAVSELLIFSICLLFLFYSFYYSEFEIYKCFFFKIFLFVYLFLIINTFWSKDFFLSLKVTLPYIRYGILSLVVWYVYENNINFKNNLKIFFVPLILFLVIDGYIQFFFGKNIIGYSTNSVRLSSFFFDEWILGSFIQKFLPLIFLIMFYKEQSSIRIYSNLIFILLSLILIYLTGERAAFFLGIFYLVLIFYFLILLFFNKNLYLYFLLLSFFLIIIFNLPLKDRIFLFAENTLFIEKFINFYHESYKYFHMTSLNIYKDHEFIGSGVKTFRILCKEYFYLDQIKSCSTHPHNFYFQVIAETGFFGLIILSLIFLIFTFRYLKFYLLPKKLVLNNLEQIFIISGVVVYLFPIATTGNFFNNFLSIIFFFNLGFVIKKKL